MGLSEGKLGSVGSLADEEIDEQKRIEHRQK